MSPASTYWRTQVLAYVSHINDYVAEGDRTGWENASDEPEPPELEHLLQEFLTELRDANDRQDPAAINAFREAWPPCFEPLTPLLEDNSQGIGPALHLGGADWLLRVGDPWAEGRCFVLTADGAQECPDIEHFGASPCGHYIALLSGDRIDIHEGWQGPRVSSFPRPRGDEDAPQGVKLRSAAKDLPDTVHQLTPFDQGRRLLVTLQSGVLVLAADGVRRLLPEPEELLDSWERADENERSEGVQPFADMVHAAVSPDAQRILAGIQDGRHRVFRADTCERVGVVGPHGEYPHHAGFAADGQQAYFNACHFYDGATIGVPVKALEGFDSEFYDAHDSITLLQEGARVYASVGRADEIILGDAYGYLHAISPTGELRWKHFVGSTVSALALSRDKTQLMVGTYAGWALLLALDSAEPAPERIGNSSHKEIRRWLFWKKEAQQPLLW